MTVAMLVVGLGWLVYLCLSPALANNRLAYLDDTRLYYRSSGAALGKGAWIWVEEVPKENPSRQLVVDAGGQLWLKPVGARLPYRDFAAEYPPLSFALFLIPRMFTDSVETYHLLFSGFMSLFAVGLLYVFYQTDKLLGSADAIWPIAAWTLWIACSGPLLVYRFDVAAVFFVALGVLLFLKGRPLWAGIAIGAAISIKIWPVFLLLPLAATLPLTRWKNALHLLAGAAILPLLTHAALMPWTGTKVLSYFAYHGKRGVHIESFWSTLIALAHPNVKSISNFGAWHFDIPSAPWVQLSYAAMILTNLACIALAYLRIGPSDPTTRAPRTIALVLLTITCLILSAKVLSVQYLFWLFPFALLLVTYPPYRRWGIAAAVAYLLALALGQYWYPWHFQPIVDLTPAGLALVATRNALLLLIAIAAAIPLLQKSPQK
jgi:hypothetical protein